MKTILDERQMFGKQLHESIGKVIETLEAAIGNQNRIDELERELVSVLMSVGLACLEEFIAAGGDGDQGKQLKVNQDTPQEKTLNRSGQKHARLYRSIFGPVGIERFVYFVREKTKILAAPLDEKLGLPADEVSYVLEDWLTSLSVNMPYDSATRWLEQTLGIQSHGSMAQRRVGKLGQFVEQFNDQRSGVPVADEKEILVVMADGKGVPVRRSLESRLEAEYGIKPHKRRCKNDYKKSVRRSTVGDKNVSTQRATVGACYSIDRHHRTAVELLEGEKNAAPAPSNKRLWAELTWLGEEVSRGAERVFESLAGEVLQRNPENSKTVVCIMDGDRALWRLQQTHLPKAVCILDLYHVTEKLWKAAHCFHREASIEAEQFVAQYLRMLLEGKVDNVRGVFQRFLNGRPLTKTKQTNLQEVITYFRKNRTRMRYNQYLAAGYPVGSGVIEGGCKHVIGDRLCGTGMRWEIEGSQPMLDLRVTQLNGEWRKFFSYYIKQQQSQLYSQAA